MAQTKVNNSFLKDKIALRINHLPDGDLRVLDCFAGSGLIWQAIARALPERSIKVLPIDTQPYDGAFRLPGDNRRYLSELDLSRFNVIDLDAYGVPIEQLETIFERGYNGVVFVTFIQSAYGTMPYAALQAIGFSESQIEKCPTLFSERGWKYFREYLALRGVRRIVHRSRERKHYLAFNCAEEHVADYGSLPAGMAASLS